MSAERQGGTSPEERRRRDRRDAAPVVMWEVRAAEGRLDDLIAYAAEQAVPEAQVYRSADRVVVIDPTGVGLSAVPAELMAREPQQWSFDPVARTGERQQSSPDE